MTAWSTDARFVVTGPTGWIGTAFLASLAQLLGSKWRQQVALFGSRSRTIIAPDGRPAPVNALCDLTSTDVEGAIVIHLAYLTKDKASEFSQEQYLANNIRIDSILLSCLAPVKPKFLFVASSGAAQAAEDNSGRDIYGISKLIQEDRYLEYSDISGAAVMIGRIYNISGPFANKITSYALSSFLHQSLTTGRIVVNAAIPVFRSYLHVLDLCQVIIGAAAQERWRSGSLNICGQLVVEMQDVAEEAARATRLDPKRITRPEMNFETSNVYVGNSIKFRTLALELGVTLRPFATQVSDAAADMVARGITSVDAGLTSKIEHL